MMRFVSHVLVSLCLLLLFVDSFEAFRIKRKKKNAVARREPESKDYENVSDELGDPDQLPFFSARDLGDLQSFAPNLTADAAAKRLLEEEVELGRGAPVRLHRINVEDQEALQTWDVKGVPIPHPSAMRARAFHAYSILRVSPNEDASGPYKYFQFEYSQTTIEFKEVSQETFETGGTGYECWEVLRMTVHRTQTTSEREGVPLIFPNVNIQVESHSTARTPEKTNTGKVKPGKFKQSPGQDFTRFLDKVKAKVDERTASQGGGLTWDAEKNNCQHFIETIVAALCKSEQAFMALYQKGLEHDGIVAQHKLAWFVSTVGHFTGKALTHMPWGPKYKLSDVEDVKTLDYAKPVLHGRILELRVYWNDATLWALPMLGREGVKEDAKKRPLALREARKQFSPESM